MLQISRNTLDLWLKKEQETGDFNASTNRSKGRPPKIKDESKFEQFIQENQDKTQQELAQLWGENLTQQNVSYACRKLGITQKKVTTIPKKTENNKQSSLKDSE